MIAPAVGAALASGAASLLSNFISSYHNEQMVRQTNDVNKEHIAEQNRLNLEQWQRENAYNSPVNQIQRLRAAGLNPGIMYGSGGVVNSSAPSPAMQSSRDVPPQSTFNIDPLTAAQIANLNAQTQKTTAETETENYNRQVIHDKLISEVRSNYANIDKTAAEIARYAKQNELDDATIHNLSFDQWYKTQSLNLDFSRLENENILTKAQVANLSADTRKKLAEAKVTEREFYEMVHTFAIRKAGLANDVNLKAAQIEQARATARKLGVEADLNSFEAVGQSQLANEFKDGDIGATILFILGDVISRFGRIFHK